MRPPLSSRTNSLPTASLRPDVGLGLVTGASVIAFTFHNSGRSARRNGAAGTQTFYVVCVEAELLEDFLAVFTKLGRASGRDLGHAMHLKGAADREREVPAGAIKWHDNVVR